MKLKDGFITHTTNGEHIVVATGEAAENFNGLIRNNDSAHYIYSLLSEDTTVEKIVEAMYQKYNAPKDLIEKDVIEFISQLRNAGFLDE